MTRMTLEELEKKKAEIDADREEADDILRRAIEAMDKRLDSPNVKDNPELAILYNANALVLMGLRSFNI